MYRRDADSSDKFSSNKSRKILKSREIYLLLSNDRYIIYNVFPLLKSSDLAETLDALNPKIMRAHYI